WDPSHYAYDLGSPDLDLSFDPNDSAPFTPKCIVTDPDELDWTGDVRPRVRWADTIVYETHVRGFTMLHPAVPREKRGTFDGLA
ncbi:glycogen debranching enzyme, partial [Mycobacterium tuberculosis]|nr:glycogen debranching enzyme [Mycobacterium tuberculosis]